jgi:integrase
MSLKVVKRPGRHVLYVRGTVRGQTVFESTETSDPKQAEGYRIKREAEIWDRSVHGTRATVSFAEAVVSYLEAHPPSFSTKRAVSKLLDHFRHTQLAQIDQVALDGAYRKLLGKDVGGATKTRHVLTPLRAILEHAARRGWCDRPVFERPKIAEALTEYRTPAQVDALIANAAAHAKPLFTFLAGCGTRPSEAFELDWEFVDLEGARCMVGQKQGDARYVDMSPRVVAALAVLPHRKGSVFRSSSPTIDKDGNIKLGDPYRTGESDKGNASGQAKRAFGTAARLAGWPGKWRVWTPKGSKTEKREWVSRLSPYVLRHSWASWHYCLNKDLLGLRADGGWKTIEMVTHYAKKMPDAYRPQIIKWMDGGLIEIRKAAQ